MKKINFLAVGCFAFAGLSAQNTNLKHDTKRLQQLYKNFDKSVQESRRQAKHGAIPPNEYFLQDLKATMDPKTGETYYDKIFALKNDIDAGKFRPEKPISMLSSSSKTGKFDQQWIERGPYSVGGRTRAIMFDPNDPAGKRVFAGGVSGGLWVNADPSVATNEWTPVSNFWANISVSSITYDPNNTNVLYVGTGEAETGDANGSGIWKSTDGGATWKQIFTIPMTYSGTIRNGNFYVNDIKVRNNNGVSEVYAGVSGGYVGIQFNDGFGGLNQAGLYKSTDGGATFTKNNKLLATNTTTNTQSTTGYSIQQIEIGADNSVWVSTRSSRFSNIDSGGRIFRATDGENFKQVYNIGVPGNRVRFGLSATNANKAYALMQGAGSTEPVRIIKTTDGGTTWVGTNDASPVITLPKDADTGIPANDFTRGQAFYDLIIVPDPTNDEIVYTGGIDLFKSTDGAATWSQISKWSNNNNLAALKVSLVHADQHEIVFNPKNPKQMLFGNDGGIFFVDDNTSFVDNAAAFNTKIPARNSRYNVTQFYNATLNPVMTPANEDLLAGAQDNGTVWLSEAPNAAGFLKTYPARGGDGMYTEYDDQDKYEIASYVYNSHYLATSTGWYTIIANQNYGHFVNEIALDRVNDILYSYRSGLSVFRTPNLLNNTTFTNTAVTLGTAQSGEQLANMKVSPYSATGTSTLFAGTNQGRILKVTDADKSTFSTTITTLPAVGTVSDIEFGATEKSIVATLSNFNVPSVFYSADGGATWVSKEGNLPDMPVRTALMNPDNNNEVILGTELGIWGTTNFMDPTPTWSQYSNGIGNVRVTWLDYRPATKTLLAATYGRGAWTSQNSTVDMAVKETKNRNIALIYPNPSKGEVSVKYDTNMYKNVTANIFDAAGRLVKTVDSVKSGYGFDTKLKAGNYRVVLADNGVKFFSSFLIITDADGEVD